MARGGERGRGGNLRRGQDRLGHEIRAARAGTAPFRRPPRSFFQPGIAKAHNSAGSTKGRHPGRRSHQQGKKTKEKSRSSALRTLFTKLFVPISYISLKNFPLPIFRIFLIPPGATPFHSRCASTHQFTLTPILFTDSWSVFGIFILIFLVILTC